MAKYGIKRSKIVLFGCLTVTAVVYLPSLDNHLVADSWVFMMPHSFFDNFAYFFKTMLPPEFNALWLRPVPMFTFWFDNVVWPGTEWGPHLTNILFHLCNVWLIWLLVRFIRSRSEESLTESGGDLPALAACLMYGLHPLTAGSVGWVAARFDVMSVTFGLAGMLMWLKWESGAKGKYLLWSLFFLLAGMFSKEQGIVFIAVCFLLSSLRMVVSPAERKRNRNGLIVLCLMTAVYIVFRLVVFGGIGGYIESRHGLSIRPPVFYLAALFFPYPNVLPDRQFSPAFAAAVCFIAALVIYLWKTTNTPQQKRVRIPIIYILFASALCIFGAATNAPSPGLTFEQILGHAESRFALNSIAGLSILTGIAADVILRKYRIYRVLLVLILLWGITAAWRTGVQIQAWDNAGKKARVIIEDTLRLAPEPPLNSHLIFIDIPRNNDQYAYIFGIGLKEALLLKYRRPDLTIIRFPKREDLRKARPERDFVFQYDKITGKLEKLRGERKKKKTE